MGLLKIIFVSTTYAIPVYVIGMFDFSTPCLNMYYGKASIFGVWDLLVPYLTYFFVIGSSLLECILRCFLYKEMDYYDCFCITQRKICKRNIWIICCCFPVIKSIALTITIAMIFAFGFTSILWYKALVSHFPKAVALATMTFIRFPLQIIHILLTPCRN